MEPCPFSLINAYASANDLPTPFRALAPFTPSAAKPHSHTYQFNALIRTRLEKILFLENKTQRCAGKGKY